MKSPISLFTLLAATVALADAPEAIQRVTGYQGDILFDPTKPDGTPRKLLDVSRLSSLGWTARIPLEAGLESTYRWFTATR